MMNAGRILSFLNGLFTTWPSYVLNALPSQVCGVSLVIIGAWARLQKAEFGSIDNLSTDPAFFLLLLGFLTIVISSFGCFGALRENICLLKTVSQSRALSLNVAT